MTTLSPDAVAPAAWLKAAGRPWRRLAMLAGVLTVADVAPAVGFAAGLALTISNFEAGPTEPRADDDGDLADQGARHQAEDGQRQPGRGSVGRSRPRCAVGCWRICSDEACGPTTA